MVHHVRHQSSFLFRRPPDDPDAPVWIDGIPGEGFAIGTHINSESCVDYCDHLIWLYYHNDIIFLIGYFSYMVFSMLY